jgi:hypothetical protein
MLGRAARREIDAVPSITPQSQLLISDRFDLGEVLPQETREAFRAAETYKLFFVFEQYLRDFILTVLSETDKDNWWDSVPQHIRDEVSKLEDAEDRKRWMNLDSREKLSLTTLPQLLAIIDDNSLWKSHFEPLVRDKQLIQQSRLVVHTRNTICHMSSVTSEEHERLQQVMRDWFRVIAP